MADNNKKIRKEKPKKMKYRVSKLDENKNVIEVKEFHNQTEASKYLGVQQRAFSDYINNKSNINITDRGKQDVKKKMRNYKLEKL